LGFENQSEHGCRNAGTETLYVAWKLHALLGPAALACSTVLALGVVDRDREPSAPDATPAVMTTEPAEPGDETAFTRDEDTESPANVGLPAMEGGLAAPSKPATVPRPSKPPVRRRVLRVTAYCDNGVTASGIRSGVGQCAAPRDVPFGSKIYIPALRRTFVVTDRTHPRFRHNTVDIFIPSEMKCLRFGRSYLECHITPPPKTASRLASR
jgi:rare lipoprotein A